MSDENDIGGANGNDMLAAEYVLGVLAPAQRRVAERKLAQDPAFAARVAFWETRLGDLVDEVAEEVPPESVWRGIDAGLSALSPRPDASRGLWQSLVFWRTLAIASAGLAAASIAALVHIAPRPATPLVATLEEKSGQPGFIAATNPADSSVTIVPAALLAGEQRAYELWLIPPGGKPHSLGLVDPAKPVKVRVPRELLPHVSADSTLAVSLEPPGGSPTGQPTGPIIANGKLASL
jgi:anti-sigma-K factor RskA